MKNALAGLSLSLLLISPVLADPTPSPARMGITPDTTNPQIVSVLTPLGWSAIGSVDTTTNVFTPVSGSGTSFASWVPQHTYFNAPTVAITSANALLPASSTALFYNGGSFPIVVMETNDGVAVVTAATADLTIQPGQTLALGTTGFTNFAYMAVGGTSALQVSGGDGLFTGVGGGGLGGGGGSGCPLGTQTVNASCAVTPATGSVWTTAPSANTTTNADITVVDSVTVCANTPAPIQSQCTGTPTAGSVASVALTGQQGLAVVASITSGSVATVQWQTEYSWDGGTTWYGRGLFLDSNTAPIWKNGIANAVFSGSTAIPPGATNFRVRATTLTGTTPHINIRIILSPTSSAIYSYNTATSAAGQSPVAADAVQGISGGTPVTTNLTQQAGLTLANPTAPGVPAAAGLIPSVNAIGSFTASFAGYAPATVATPMSLTTASSRQNAPAGATVVLFNVGANDAYVTIGATGSVTATTAMDRVSPGGCWAYVQTGSQAIAGITSLGATTLNVTAGSGWPLGCGGAGGTAGTVVQGTFGFKASPSTITVTRIITASGALSTYITGLHFYVDNTASAPANFQIVYGTQTTTACDTGQTAITDVETYAAGNGTNEGGGLGPWLFIPASKDVCIKTGVAQLVHIRGAATQF